MKPNRVSYGSKYAVQIRVPKKPPKQVVCEFAWQVEDVVEREKKNVDNMVHGTVIIRTRHAQPMQRWEFDAEDVRWHSIYTRNERRLAPGKAAKGDKVQFVYRGRVVTGKVVRVKKDGIRTVELDGDDFDEVMVDVKPSVARKYVLVDYEFDRAAGRYTMEHEEAVSLQEFIDANAHDAEVMDEMDKIRELPVGGEVKFGGGAAPLTAIRRVS